MWIKRKSRQQNIVDKFNNFADKFQIAIIIAVEDVGLSSAVVRLRVALNAVIVTLTNV